MNKFYLADETHRKVTGELVELKGMLYFTQERSGYDGKATKDHVKQYPGEYEAFRKANPDYVLPDSFKDVAIGDAVVTPVVVPMVVEAPVVDESKKKSFK